MLKDQILKPGLRLKIISIIIMFILTMTISLVWFFMYTQEKILIYEVGKWGGSLAVNLAHNSEYGILVEDRLILHQLLDNIKQEKGITNVILTDLDGAILSSFHSINNDYLDVIKDFSPNEIAELRKVPYQSEIRDGELVITTAVQTKFEKLMDFDWLMKQDDDLTEEVADNKDSLKLVGFIQMHIALDETYLKLADTRNMSITIISMISIIFGLLLSRMLDKVILYPINVFAHGAEAISTGKYDQHIQIETGDEIGRLAVVFNKMVDNINRSHEKIKDYAHTLEEKVSERTNELEQRNHDLYKAHANIIKRENKLRDTQSQLVLSEKMASLGILIAGIAHEINTPVGAIANASRELRDSTEKISNGITAVSKLDDNKMSQLKTCIDDFTNMKSTKENNIGIDLWRKSKKIRKHLVAIGLMNHKVVSSTLSKFCIWDVERIESYKAILSDSRLLGFAEAIGTMEHAQRVCHMSSDKIIEIIKALKYYAYTDKGNTELIDINESLDNALILMHNKLKYNFNIIKHYGKVPSIYCTSEINQVWTNLLSNSHDAVTSCGGDYKGNISLETTDDDDNVIVKLSDNGSGIPADKLNKVFDPFFTTKGIGSGTGLGLSIVSGIIKKHNGTINVNSVPGKTIFTITLPKGKKDESSST